MVDSANSCNPVHPRDRSCQNGCTRRPPHPAVGPSGFEVKENSKGNGRSDDGNESGADDIPPLIAHIVIGYPLLAKVVHATDSSAGSDADDDDSADVDFFGKAQEIESNTHNTNWEEEGPGGAACTVSDLKFAFSVVHSDSTVANEMH